MFVIERKNQALRKRPDTGSPRSQRITPRAHSIDCRFRRVSVPGLPTILKQLEDVSAMRGSFSPILNDQETACKFRRKRSGSPGRSRASTAACVFLQIGMALTSTLRPSGVSVITRPRRSAGSTVILSKRLRCNGLRAAVNVVRSIPSSEATALMSAGSGRFSDISSENCPLVSPAGRSARSKRRASALAARWT